MAAHVLGSLSANNLFDLTGVVAVVTGGGTGIGLMIATTLLANGATVYIIGPKQEDLDKITQVYNEAAAQSGRSGRIYGIEGDISKKSEAARLAEEIAKREQHVTVLFSNAGISDGHVNVPEAATGETFRKAYFDELPEDAFNRVFTTNAVASYWVTFAFLPLLEKWKESPGAGKFAPQVVITSSFGGWIKDASPGYTSFPYMFSKSAVGHATASLAHELLPLGIRVNGIAPGLFVTEMSAPGTMDATGISHLPPGVKFRGQTPVSRPVAPGQQRAGTNLDMGTLALFLVANWFVDGETILIDGGSHLMHPSSY